MNNKIKSKADLVERIKLLELAKVDNDQALYGRFEGIADRLKPSHLMEAAIDDLKSHQGLQSDLTGYLIATISGLLTKKLWVGKSKNPIRQLFGTLLEVWVANFAMKHADTIRVSVQKLIDLIGHSLEAKKEQHQE